MSQDLEMQLSDPLKIAATYDFCGMDAKNRNHKSQPQITVANHTYERISIEIDGYKKSQIAVASRKSRTCESRLKCIFRISSLTYCIELKRSH